MTEDGEGVTGFKFPLARGRAFAGPTGLVILEAATVFPGSTSGTTRLPEGQGIQAVDAFSTDSTFGTDGPVDTPPMHAAAAAELAVTIKSDLKVELAVVFLTPSRDFEAGTVVAARDNV